MRKKKGTPQKQRGTYQLSSGRKKKGTRAELQPKPKKSKNVGRGELEEKAIDWKNNFLELFLKRGGDDSGEVKDSRFWEQGATQGREEFDWRQGQWGRNKPGFSRGWEMGKKRHGRRL